MSQLQSKAQLIEYKETLALNEFRITDVMYNVKAVNKWRTGTAEQKERRVYNQLI